LKRWLTVEKKVPNFQPSQRAARRREAAPVLIEVRRARPPQNECWIHEKAAPNDSLKGTAVDSANCYVIGPSFESLAWRHISLILICARPIANSDQMEQRTFLACHLSIRDCRCRA